MFINSVTLQFRPLNISNIPPLTGVIFVRVKSLSLTKFVGVSRDNNPTDSWDIYPGIATSLLDAFGNRHFVGIRLLCPTGFGIENGPMLGALGNTEWMRNLEWALPEYGD